MIMIIIKNHNNHNINDNNEDNEIHNNYNNNNNNKRFICFAQKLVEIDTVVLEKKFFLSLTIHFHHFVIIPPCKKAVPFTWTILILLISECFLLWQRQRRRTYNFWSEKLTWALDSGEIMMKNYTRNNKGSMCHIA